MITIDGSYGEGGGQILRTAIALSSLTGKPVEVVNIRAKRPNPGLQPQHLTGVKAAALLTNAEVVGAERGSTRLVYRPGVVKCGQYTIDVGTAGSVSLVIQTLAPLLIYAPCPTKVTIVGGTDVSWSPPVDYMRFVFVPVLRKFGVDMEITLLKRGHYPKGGGRVVVETRPVERLKAVEAPEFGRLARVGGISHCVNLPQHVAERQARAAREALGLPAEIEIERGEGLGPGSGVVLWAISDLDNVVGGDALGERGKPAEAVGREAAEELLAVLKSGASLDPHMADMAVLYMALADGVSRMSTPEVTSHLETNVHVVKKFLPTDIKLSQHGGRWVMEVRGVGFRR